jgi:hypothetical protein
MAKKQQRRARNPRSVPQSQKHQDKWWKRPASWCFGMANGFAVAFVAAFAGALGGGAAALIPAVTGHTAPAAPSGPPVKIEQVTPFSTSPDNSFVVPGSVQLSRSQLYDLSLPDGNNLAAFEEKHHAVGIGAGSTSVTVVGNSTGTVTITGLQIVKQCTSPLKGTYFYNPAAGENTTISLGFNLDSQPDYAQDTHAGRDYSGNFFLEHVVNLAPGEPQTFVIFVSTVKQYCQFSFQLTVATPKGAVIEVIPRDGKKFALTGMAGPGLEKSGGVINLSAYSRAYVGGVADFQNGNQWIEVNPATFNGMGNPASFPPSP